MECDKPRYNKSYERVDSGMFRSERRAQLYSAGDAFCEGMMILTQSRNGQPSRSVFWPEDEKVANEVMA